MSLTPDILLDRSQLKQRLRKWQVIAVVVPILLLLALAAVNSKEKDEVSVGDVKVDYIARVKIDGMIVDDTYREKVLKKLAKDKYAKAVILSIDSPGGTTGGSEELYNQFLEISKAGKPVVVTMRTLAASGGYMTALAGDHILALNGTITGSIGVLMQSFEITDLAEKLGIKFVNIKSSELKASPSPFEKTTPKAAAAIQSVIDSYYAYFVALVMERRHMDKDKAFAVADGRVYTGIQALQNGLIDGIGGEKEAVAWLQKNKNISSKLEVEDISTTEPEKSLKDILFGDSKETKMLSELTTGGLLAVWKP